MGLYQKWCDTTKEKDKRKRYWTYVEKDGGRDEIRDGLAETIRSHYDRLERIAEDVERLGYKVAAKILSEAMPQTPKGRSGDLDEILATELVEEEIGLRVPVRRLRYKDGRNIAMRGDDFIGAGYDAAGEKLWLLNGEAKSNKVLGKATITSARKVLNRDNGRCTPEPCLQAADILAGCAMRFARDGQARKGCIEEPLRAVFHQMIDAGNLVQGTSINLVMSTRLLETLGVPHIPAGIVDRMLPRA